MMEMFFQYQKVVLNIFFGVLSSEAALDITVNSVK